MPHIRVGGRLEVTSEGEADLAAERAVRRWQPGAPDPRGAFGVGGAGRAERPIPAGAALSVHLGAQRWVGDGVSAWDGQRRGPSDPSSAGAGRAPCVAVGRRGDRRPHGVPFPRSPRRLPRDTRSCRGDGHQGPDGGHLGECLNSCPRVLVCARFPAFQRSGSGVSLNETIVAKL